MYLGAPVTVERVEVPPSGALQLLVYLCREDALVRVCPSTGRLLVGPADVAERFREVIARNKTALVAELHDEGPRHGCQFLGRDNLGMRWYRRPGGEVREDHLFRYPCLAVGVEPNWGWKP